MQNCKLLGDISQSSILESYILTASTLATFYGDALQNAADGVFAAMANIGVRKRQTIGYLPYLNLRIAVKNTNSNTLIFKLFYFGFSLNCFLHFF